jgi:hypothetical protein
MSVSGNPTFHDLTERQMADMQELQAMRDEPLDPELEDYIEESETWGRMLRHPLVYQIPLFTNGHANRVLRQKQKVIAKAEAEQDWATVVWMHERPYRLGVLIDYLIGRDEDGDIITLDPVTTPQSTLDLVADVWVDSENIQQNIEDWRMVFGHAHGLWIGTAEERAEFEALPTIPHKDGPRIHAWRGGAVGDWSWTTDRKVAEFFSKRSGLPVRGHQIPVSDVFGYLTRRNEAELLVKFTEFRRDLVYPGGEPE